MTDNNATPIGDIVKKANTGLDAIKRAPIVDHDTGIKCLRIQDVSQSKDYKYWGFTEVEQKNYKKFQLTRNDIILARTGASIGVNKIIKEDLKAVFNNGLIRIRVKKNKCTPEYLYYNFRSQKYTGFIESISGGTSTQPNMQINALLSYEITLPPLPEQKAIASVLSSLDDKIDLLHRQNKTLEAMAETLFRQWFVEEAQEDWEDGCLEDIADINPTYQLKKGALSSYLEMRKVSTSTFNPEGWTLREFTSGMKFQNGDTLLARITPCLENGKTCFVTFLNQGETGWGSTEYIVIKMKEPFHAFISYIIAKSSDFRDFAISRMSGSSGRQRAQANIIKEYDIKTPPLSIIKELNGILASLVEKLETNSNQIRTLEKLRDTLLPKLMSGEVRVDYNET